MRVNISPMKNGKGFIKEIFLDGSARIECPPELIPAPGQYLLAHAHASDLPIADPLFFSHSAPTGFFSAPTSTAWMPGTVLNLRGPLGHGFSIPASARKVALIAFDDSPARLRGLISPAIKQNAEVVLLCDSQVDDLPELVEVQPLQAMLDIFHWADYAAVDVARGNLNQLKEKFGRQNQAWARPERQSKVRPERQSKVRPERQSKVRPERQSKGEAQVLIRTQMPCGALAECGVCAVRIHHHWEMACKDGPVFELKEIL
ncbi:MAG: hypothetical protein HZB18_15135 [Chloroflexi bacterium]|nr:hypothetical protein [Chloroflexota bacterium]